MPFWLSLSLIPTNVIFLTEAAYLPAYSRAMT